MRYRTIASEMIPTTTITSKLFEMIALITVGIEAMKFGMSIVGRWPRC